MTSRSGAQAYFLIGAIVASSVLALVATYAYGGLFAHERYWEGTRKRVAEKDAQVISGMLSTAETQAAFPRDPEVLKLVFEPLDRLLIFELEVGDSVIYSNRDPKRDTGTLLVRVPLGGYTPLERGDDHVLTISRYQSPTWLSRFGHWLTHPGEWLTTSYNQITGSYAAFFVVLLIGCIALGWRARAGHLERDVLTQLRAGDRE